MSTDTAKTPESVKEELFSKQYDRWLASILAKVEAVFEKGCLESEGINGDGLRAFLLLDVVKYLLIKQAATVNDLDLYELREYNIMAAVLQFACNNLPSLKSYLAVQGHDYLQPTEEELTKLRQWFNQLHNAQLP